jgi:hypothetical protein
MVTATSDDADLSPISFHLPSLSDGTSLQQHLGPGPLQPAQKPVATVFGPSDPRRDYKASAGVSGQSGIFE